MACNVSNGASRRCSKINALLHGKECIYSLDLMHSVERRHDGVDGASSEHKVYRLALGTNLGRVLVVTLRDEMSWSNTRRSFITQYAVGSAVTTTPSALGAVDGGSQRRSGRAAVSGGKSVRRRKTVSSMRYSVLTARERRFRELADPDTVTIDLEAMRRFLTKEAPEVEAVDVDGHLVAVKLVHFCTVI